MNNKDTIVVFIKREIVKKRLLNLVGSIGNRAHMPEIEFNSIEGEFNSIEGEYYGSITEELFKKVYEEVNKLKNENYIRYILFRTPFNAEVETVRYNNLYRDESYYMNLPRDNREIHYCNDLIRVKWINEIKECLAGNNNRNNEFEEYLRINKQLHIRNSELETRLKERNEKLNELDCLIDRCSGLEGECKRLVDNSKTLKETEEKLKTANLELQTELMATRMANYCLETPEDLEKVEEMLAEKKSERGTIVHLNNKLEKKAVEIKVLKNKLAFVRGQKDMIAEVLRGGNLVVHREVNNRN